MKLVAVGPRFCPSVMVTLRAAPVFLAQVIRTAVLPLFTLTLHTLELLLVAVKAYTELPFLLVTATSLLVTPPALIPVTLLALNV